MVSSALIQSSFGRLLTPAIQGRPIQLAPRNDEGKNQKNGTTVRSKTVKSLFLAAHGENDSGSVIPVLSNSEVQKILKQNVEKYTVKEPIQAMYSSVFGGITTDPTSMVVPIDDHMVHRGHGVFDTAIIADGHLYELDPHLDRLMRSASLAKISSPFTHSQLKAILIQTAAASQCKEGYLKYWLSAGPGDFSLSSRGCIDSTFYAVVLEENLMAPKEEVRVVTSSVPMKPPIFAVMKNVNYLPNALSQLEAEEKGAYAAIWVDSEGFVAEGPNMNVAFVSAEDELIMPAFEKVLSGCTAKRVLTIAANLVDQGFIRSVEVKNVPVEEGKASKEMMLIGSGELVRPVVMWDENFIGNGKGGPVTLALQRLLVEDLISGPAHIRIPVPYNTEESQSLII